MDDSISTVDLNCTTYHSFYRYCPVSNQWVVCNVEKCPYEKNKKIEELIDEVKKLIEEIKKYNPQPYCPYPYPTIPYPNYPYPTYPYYPIIWDLPTTDIIPDCRPLITYCKNY